MGIPTDVTQQSLSFDSSNDNNLVNKTFKECHDKNKAMRERQRLSAINEYDFNPNIKYDATKNKTWIVRDAPLNDEEIEKGYLLSDNLQAVINGCEAGDIIHIYEQYEGSSRLGLTIDIQIIGIGKNVMLKHRTSKRFCNFIIKPSAKVHIKNIYFDAIHNFGVLWTEQCSFMNTINVYTPATAYVKQCVFLCGNLPNVVVKPSAKCVHIIGCKFQNNFSETARCPQSRVVVDSVRDRTGKKGKKLVLKCIGNTFENNKSIPFAEIIIEGERGALDSSHIVLKHNILIGRTVTHEANKLYTVQE